MFDKIAGIGSSFDWITPLITLIQNYRNRPSVGYSVPVDCGWSAYAISDLLNDHGVKHWGLHIYHNTIMFRLRVAQAAYSQYLFEQNAVVYSGGIELYEDVALADKEPSPKKRQSTDALLGNVLKGINNYADKMAGERSQT